MSAFSASPRPETAEPRFKIGQDVHLKTGGPDMVVNQCTAGPDGAFVVATVWFGAEGTEEHGSYLEGLLEARAVVLGKYKR